MRSLTLSPLKTMILTNLMLPEFSASSMTSDVTPWIRDRELHSALLLRVADSHPKRPSVARSRAQPGCSPQMFASVKGLKGKLS